MAAPANSDATEEYSSREDFSLDRVDSEMKLPIMPRDALRIVVVHRHLINDIV